MHLIGLIYLNKALCCFKAVYEKFSVKHMKEGKGAYRVLLGKSEGQRGGGDRLVKKLDVD
jgi:hypothetical protein